VKSRIQIRNKKFRIHNTVSGSEQCFYPRDELTARFKLTVELSSREGASGGGSNSSGGGQEDKAATDLSKFMLDPDFQYVDFAQRDKQSSYSTFRIQVCLLTLLPFLSILNDTSYRLFPQT
jgi:hypothetical protein